MSRIHWRNREFSNSIMQMPVSDGHKNDQEMIKTVL